MAIVKGENPSEIINDTCRAEWSLGDAFGSFGIHQVSLFTVTGPWLIVVLIDWTALEGDLVELMGIEPTTS